MAKKAATDYREAIFAPNLGHARGHSCFVCHPCHKEHLLYQALPNSSQKALDDFLLTFKDLEINKYGLGIEKVLPEKRIKVYQRALNQIKKAKK